MNPEELKRLFTLLGALRDEVISPDEFEALNALLENNETAQEYYLDYVYLCTDLCNLQAAIKQDDLSEEDLYRRQAAIQPTLTLGMLRELGDYERNAETVHLPKKAESSKSATLVIERVPVTLPRRKVSKLSIVTFVTSLAALLFLVAYVHIVLPDPSYEVATLSDSMDAQWASSAVLQNGARLSAPSSEPFRLQPCGR